MSQPARIVTVAATQFACSWDLPANLAHAERLVREAHARGARIILLQELFATPYFCIEQDARHLQLAESADDSPLLRRFGALAAELAVVLPISFFERAGDVRCRRTAARHLSQVAHPKWPRLPGEVLFQPRGHRLSRLGHALWAARRRHLLGSVVSRKCPHHGADGCRAAAVSDRDRQ